MDLQQILKLLLDRRVRVPKYRRNPDGRAFIEVDKKRHYLGRFGTDESRARYEAALLRLASGAFGENSAVDDVGLLVSELMVKYLDDRRVYFKADEKPGWTEFDNLKTAIVPFVQVYQDAAISDIRPTTLLDWQRHLISLKLARSTINKRVGAIVRMFKWGVSRELVPVDVLTALQTVESLRAGRTEAAEAEPVTAIDRATVEKTLPCMTPVVAAAVQTQWMCGMRPSEALRLTPADIRQDGEIWLYVPASHKNQHRGHTLVKAIPRRVQVILTPFLDRPADACLFSPQESQLNKKTGRTEPRKTKVYPSEIARRKRDAAKAARRKPQAKTYYTTNGYRQSIHRACDQAGVEQWNPNQLRHSLATEISETLGLGIQAAQRYLGHAKMDTTLIYAEREIDELRRIATQLDEIWSNGSQPSLDG